MVNLINKNIEDWSDPELLQNEARDRIKEQQVKMKKFYDARHYYYTTIQRSPVQGESAKLLKEV